VNPAGILALQGKANAGYGREQGGARRALVYERVPRAPFFGVLTDGPEALAPCVSLCPQPFLRRARPSVKNLASARSPTLADVS